MAKKPMICVPKSCQQPRSHGSSKPRSDFSQFFSESSSSSSSQFNSSVVARCHPGEGGGSKLELLNGRDHLSSVTTSSMDRCCHNHDELPKFCLVQCNMSPDGGKDGSSFDSTGMTSAETESRLEEHLDVYNNRINVENRSSDTADLLCSPNKSTSQVTECSDVQATRDTIVWARTVHQMWWPSKLFKGRSAPIASNDQDADGRVLIQYCGNHELAWVDPVRDLSEFDVSFEERSSNPQFEFQVALKQALHEKEGSNFCSQMPRSPDSPKKTSRHEQSVARSNKWIESSSSREEDDSREEEKDKTEQKPTSSKEEEEEEEDNQQQGRGKRKRKPKLHFDEVTCTNKSPRKMRRFRIMRFLGLTPPIGSPFSHTTANKSC